MIRTFTPNFARAWAAMRPAGPAPMTRKSTLDSATGTVVMIWERENLLRICAALPLYLYENRAIISADSSERIDQGPKLLNEVQA